MDILQNDLYSDAVKSIETQLLTISIKDWIDEIKLAQVTSGIATSASCQTFLDELIQAYGKPSDSKFAVDLMQVDERFVMLM